MKSFLLLFLFSLLVTKEAQSSETCLCPATKINRRLKTNKKVIFHQEPPIKGEDYVRPKGSLRNEDQNPTIDLLNPCQSEQIHLSLGEDLSSIVIDWASFLFTTPATVYYSYDENSSLEEGAEGVETVHGTYRSYSELLYTVTYLTDPKMGAPTTSPQVWIDKVSLYFISSFPSSFVVGSLLAVFILAYTALQLLLFPIVVFLYLCHDLK